VKRVGQAHAGTPLTGPPGYCLERCIPRYAEEAACEHPPQPPAKRLLPPKQSY